MDYYNYSYDKLLAGGQWIGKNGRFYSTKFNGSEKWLSGSQKGFRESLTYTKTWGTRLGIAGLGFSSLSVANDLYHGEDNTATWVDYTVSGALVGGAILAGATYAPVFVAFGIGYSLYRITPYSKSADGWINRNYGYR